MRRKARVATLEALRALGGEATRSAIREHALEHGGFTDRERLARPAQPGHDPPLEYALSWTLTNLKRVGLVTNPARSVWALAGEAAVTAPPLAAPVIGRRLEQLRAMPYPAYLRSPEWRETRAAALVRAGHACQLDLTHVLDLEVHHRTYARLGEERPEDLFVLCEKCHQNHHAFVGRPSSREPLPESAPPPFVAGVSPPPKSFLGRLRGRSGVRAGG